MSFGLVVLVTSSLEGSMSGSFGNDASLGGMLYALLQTRPIECTGLDDGEGLSKRNEDAHLPSRCDITAHCSGLDGAFIGPPGVAGRFDGY